MNDKTDVEAGRRALDEERKHWHSTKSVSWPVILLLIGNIVTMTWWAATLQADEHAHYKEMQDKTAGVVNETQLAAQLQVRDLGIKHNAEAIERIYETQKEYLLQVLQGTQRLQSLLENLLIWARSQMKAVKYEPSILHVKPFIDECVKELNANLDHKKIDCLACRLTISPVATHSCIT